MPGLRERGSVCSVTAVVSVSSQQSHTDRSRTVGFSCTYFCSLRVFVPKPKTRAALMLTHLYAKIEKSVRQCSQGMTSTICAPVEEVLFLSPTSPWSFFLFFRLTQTARKHAGKVGVDMPRSEHGCTHVAHTLHTCDKLLLFTGVHTHHTSKYVILRTIYILHVSNRCRSVERSRLHSLP